AHGSEEHEKSGPHITHNLVLCRSDFDAEWNPAHVGLAGGCESRGQAGEKPVHIRARLLDRDTWFQAGCNFEEVVRPILIRELSRPESNGRVQLHFVVEFAAVPEPLGSDADYGEVPAIELKGFPEDAGIARESGLPQSVTQDH